MASHSKKAYFSGETACVEKASHFCSNLETDLNGLYSTAWCYTKSLYTCSSDVTSSLVQSSGREDVLQVSRVSATFVKHMTIKEASSSIRIVEAEIVENDGLASYLDHGSDFYGAGTSIWIGDIQSLHMDDSHVSVGKPLESFVVINGTQIKMGYTPNLIPAYSSEAFLDTLVKVVTQFVGQPYDTRLDVLGPYNSATLDRWTSSKLVLIERCIHHYVDEHAMQTPEKEAVVSTEGPHFTYAQLSRLSDKLAAHLASMGINKGDIVPILFEKSSIAVLAVISIIKAGLTSPLLFTVEPELGESYDEKTRVSEDVGVAQEIVRSAWMNILGVDAIEFEKCKAVQKAFLEIWGNPVSAVVNLLRPEVQFSLYT